MCGSDLRRLGDELQAAQLHHAQQLAALDRYEERVRKLYKEPRTRPLPGRRSRGERKRVFAADRANGAKFDEATARLFAVLYHEAFHAYVAHVRLPAAEARTR